MTTLFDRISVRLERGHASRPVDIWEDPRLTGDGDLTAASVLVAFTEREEPGILFLHRPSTMRAHAGQVAFPGGKRDPGEDEVDAALREAHEELGIPPDRVRVIGTSDVYRTATGYEITPVIGVVPPDLTIRPNPTEVAQWFEAPARFVLDPANQRHSTVQWKGTEVELIEILWEGHRIWGVTGAIVHNLTQRFRAGG